MSSTSGLLWSESDVAEETTSRQIHRAARRAALCMLVLAALLLFATFRISGKTRWAVGSLFVWSVVAAVYSARTYLHARNYFKHKSSGAGLTDSLTGLPNRKGLVGALSQLDAGPQEFGKRIRLIDIDLVNLNRINYEFGQTVGDAVLQDIGSLILSTVPAGCVAGRLGGDEFLVIMPQASSQDAEVLGQALGDAVSHYTLNLADRGEVRNLKARVSIADYVPERASLHETVISAKEASAHGEIPDGAEGATAVCYHVPRVTLGAFACHRWQSLGTPEQDEFKQWKREPGNAAPERMVSDVMKMLDEKAETNWVDFVTAVPAAGGPGRPNAVRNLAEAVAKVLGVPYREVMRVDSSGPEDRSVEPAVGAVIDKGDSVLLVSDVISSGIVERRCVKKLSAAGARVQVVAWAAY